MLVFAILLVAAAVVVGIYSAANGGSQDVTLFGQHGTVYTWVPPLVAAAAMGGLLLLCMAYAMARINRLRRANVGLRGEVEKLTMELSLVREVRERDLEAATAPVVGERDLVGREEHRLRPDDAEFLREREPAGVAAADHAEPHRRMSAEPGPADTGDPRVHELPGHGTTAPGATPYTPLT